MSWFLNPWKLYQVICPPGFSSLCFFKCANLCRYFAAALYLSVMTISTVGYGDIVPVTIAERCYLIFAMLIGASVYAYVGGDPVQVKCSRPVTRKRSVTTLGSYIK
jgi:hypothetical protein